MENKLPLRDFLIYLLTGVAFLVLLFPMKHTAIMNMLNAYQALLKEQALLLTTLFFVIAYVIGFVLQSVDAGRFFIAKKWLLPASKTNKWYKGICYVLFCAMADDRVLGIMNDEIKMNEFFKKAYYLQVKDKYGPSEYWYIMKDMTNGLETACLIMMFVAIFSTLNDKGLFISSYLLLAYIFWIKSRAVAKSYIESVNTIHAIVLQENITSKP